VMKPVGRQDVVSSRKKRKSDENRLFKYGRSEG
jgi:hypothetical protein